MLEQADLRAAREHADVARERELQAGAERVAAHRGDRRVPRASRATSTTPACAGSPSTVGSAWRVPASSTSLDRVVAAAAGEHRRVDAGRERAAVADHDERAQLGVVAQLLAERRASRCHISTVNELSLSGRLRRSQPTSPVARRTRAVSYASSVTSADASSRTANGRESATAAGPPRPGRGSPRP